MKLYSYKSGNNDFSIRQISVDGEVIKFKLIFDTPLPGGDINNDRVFSELYLRNDLMDKKNEAGENLTNPGNMVNSDNLMILVHGFGTKESKLKYYNHFCKKIAENNIPCVFINLPFHLNRTPEEEKSGARLISYDDFGTLEFFNQSVADIKKLLEILSLTFKVKKITLCGLSMGSMISLIAMANDSRINKGIFLLGGGNWEEIHWNGILRFILKGNCTKGGKMTREKCHGYYRHFAEFLEEFKKNRCNNLEPFSLEDFPLKKYIKKLCFLCDPMTFAHRINKDDVLMINSKFDFYFSKKSTIDLWKELGKPKIKWLNHMHSSKILTEPAVIKEILNFLK